MFAAADVCGQVNTFVDFCFGSGHLGAVYPYLYWFWPMRDAVEMRSRTAEMRTALNIEKAFPSISQVSFMKYGVSKFHRALILALQLPSEVPLIKEICDLRLNTHGEVKLKFSTAGHQKISLPTSRPGESPRARL